MSGARVYITRACEGPPPRAMAVACDYNSWAALTERGGLLLYGQYQYGLQVPTVLGGQGDHAGEAIDALVGGLEALAMSANELLLPAPAEGAAAPPPPFGDERLVMVAGTKTTACVTDSGAVWTWGRNNLGQLGLGDTVRRAQPVRWPAGACGGAVVLMVACGETHTTALTQTGEVWTCGAMFGGVVHSVPTQVPGLARVRMIAEGRPHGMALDADGQVWIWGDYWTGPLGYDTPAPEGVPPPRKLGLAAFAGVAVVFVAAGTHYAAAVTAEGQLWTWGRGGAGNLGLGDHESRASPTLVFAGQASPWAGSRVRTVSCGTNKTLVLTEDGGVWHCGVRFTTADDNTDNDMVWESVPTRVAQARFGGARVVHVAVGGCHSTAVTAEGILYVWGGNALRGGDGLYRNLRVPTPVAASLAPGSRVGRGCGLPRRHTTAFCMGTLPRLGGGSGAPIARARSVVYDANENVLQVIVQQAAALTGLYRHMGEGQLRLLAVRERVS